MKPIEILPEHPARDIDLNTELDALALRYRNASGLGMKVLGILGMPVGGLLKTLPDDVQNGLGSATELALTQAVKWADGSRAVVKDQPDWINASITAALGAAGGAGGVTSSLAELPITVTVLLRAIQGVAVQYGFDPSHDSVRFDCVQVLAANGPFEEDRGADLAMLEQRAGLAVGGAKWISAVIVPRLAPVLGQKLAAQMVPVIGAAAGAATNFAYTSYYQDIAHVHFGLRKLAVEVDVDHATLAADLVARLRKKS
ncbi:EcsC family protein [Shimia marina]|uniref:EcsC protein family protein n=1 Tax=Shimia marina TaxID=321267 RepID=A0A0P1ESG0_9RHOB|nr:EcsC family protein [Shimia marina]CUH52882.1 EcsC protein family protein [Shimia marina]SFD89463.1 EcsC protein family protein [Shimia marina]